jgi:hypothetical protein
VRYRKFEGGAFDDLPSPGLSVSFLLLIWGLSVVSLI